MREMGKNTNNKRGTLSESERLDIIKKYDAGGESYRSLAEQYDVSASTISRIIGRQQKKLNRVIEKQETAAAPSQSPPPPQQSQIDDDVIIDPLLFRQYKLAEIAGDIDATRERGSLHALPQFHRLHLQVHDEWTQMRRDAEDADGITNPDELLSNIAVAIKGLPPILRDKLEDMLNGEYNNVVNLFGTD